MTCLNPVTLVTTGREALPLCQDLPLACTRARLAMASFKGVLEGVSGQLGYGQAQVGHSPRWP